ncbi:MAG: hypothetical protein ACI8U0_002656 [Flavobacteriales bacterium]|jgi:hypothetical protein
MLCLTIFALRLTKLFWDKIFMKTSTNYLGRTIYMIVLLVAIGAVDVMQIGSSDLEMMCFVELMEGEAEPEEKESNEKTEYDFYGNKNSNNPLYYYLSNKEDAGSFNVWEYQLMDVITPPPEASLL